MNLIKSLFNTTKHHISMLEEESLIAMGGMAIEYHNIFLYGYLISILLPNFFAPESPLISFSGKLFSYAIGPLGALVCGHIGDRLGRKRILAWALMFVSISSYLISILPTYAQIGLWSSILFITLRSIQTLGFGGDAVGLVTFILEETPSKNRGLFGGLMSLGSAFGVFVASLEIALLNPLENYSPWKWRMPLSLGIIGTFISLFFFRILGETTVFSHYSEHRKIRTWPSFEILKNYKLAFLKSVGIFALAPIITIIIFGYIPYLGYSNLGLSTKFTMWSNTAVLGIFMLFAPIFGALSDKIGRKPILFFVSIVFLIFGLPLFLLLEKQNANIYFFVQLFFGWVSSAYYGLAMTVNIEHLPTRLRYTGVAFSFYVSYALFGGIDGQLIVKNLIKFVKNDYGPVFYLLIGSFIVLLSTLFLKEESRRDL